MSSSEPAGVDRTYRFISDPDHKENLSGRVRAACMNCRRKKIKCSGEINCRTCQERGIVCEGPPERKRPRRSLDLLNTKDLAGKPRQDSSSSNQTNHSPTSSSRQQSFSSSSAVTDRRRSSTQRPTLALLSKGSNDSNDSGYFSPRLETVPSSHPEPSSYDGVAKFPTSAGVRSDWAFQKAPTSAAGYVGAQQSQVDLSQHDGSHGMGSQGQSGKWPSAEEQSIWWSKQNTGGQSGPVYSDLMSTTNLLEEQALSLQQLAFTQQQQGTIDDLNMLFPSGESANGVHMGNGYEHGWWQDNNNNNNNMNSTNSEMQFRSVSYSQSPMQNMTPSDETWQRASLQAQQQQQQQRQNQQQRPQFNNSTSRQDPRQSLAGGSGRQQSTPNPGSMTMFSWAS